MGRFPPDHINDIPLYGREGNIQSISFLPVKLSRGIEGRPTEGRDQPLNLGEGSFVIRSDKSPLYKCVVYHYPQNIVIADLKRSDMYLVE